MPVIHYLQVLAAAIVAVQLTTLTVITLGSWTFSFFVGYLYTNKKKNYTSIFTALLGVFILGSWDLYRRYASGKDLNGIWGPIIATLLGASVTALTGAAANTLF